MNVRDQTVPQESLPTEPAGLIQRATVGDIERMVGILYAAFQADPVLDWLLRADGRRRAGFESFFRETLRLLCLPHQEVYLTQAGTGAALWTPPNRWRMGLLQQARLAPKILRIAGLARLWRLVSGTDMLNRQHPHQDHYYLFLLGVVPGQQGRGIGSALLQHMLTRCDREGLGVYLENTNERNLDLYTRHGFEITKVIALGAGAPPLWAMWRAPRAGDGAAAPASAV
jgi:ribosomal protein S18 acetylase RimI-like enzyme